MIPPLVRRCPECGRVSLSHRFTAVSDDPSVVECPACHHRFEPIDNPRLK